MAQGQNKNLLVRLATGFIGAPLIVLLLFVGPAWGWLVFVAVAAAIGAFELFSMTGHDAVGRALGIVLTEAVLLALWFGADDARVLLTVLILAPLVGMLLVLARLGDIHTAAVRVMANTFGPLYVGGALGAVVLLRRDAEPRLGAHAGAGFVVLALSLAWASDTGAYFAGRFLGKHKLYEAVSPKKTVEGALGGLAASLLSAVLAHFWFLPALPLGEGLALAAIAGALGQAGDLGESLLKRSFGVKDSGGIVPGHGGILDRVDALLLTGSITYLYVRWIL